MSSGSNPSNIGRCVVVVINGFMAPKFLTSIYEHQFSCYEDLTLITVNPSCVSSLHDRVMQIFYEIKGGTINYGKDHSELHGHDEIGETFESGKFSEWNEENPIHIVGHSFGGVTARVLQAYLGDGDKFSGYQTSSSWVVSVLTITTPLNGALMVYELGANTTDPTIVRWMSTGYIIGILAHFFEFMDLNVLRNIFDFQLGAWGLSRKRKMSFAKLVMALLGYCVHTTCDNAAYDMTLHSQAQWAEKLTTCASIYYYSVVGVLPKKPSIVRRIISAIRYRAMKALKFEQWNTTNWLNDGMDGLLSVKTQSFPFLGPHAHPNEKLDSSSVLYLSCHDNLDDLNQRDYSTFKIQSSGDSTRRSIQDVKSGVWYYKYHPVSHFQALQSTEIWNEVILTIQRFHQLHQSSKANHCSKTNSSAYDHLPENIANHCRSLRPDLQYYEWKSSKRPLASYEHNSYLILLMNIISITYLISLSISKPLHIKFTISNEELFSHLYYYICILILAATVIIYILSNQSSSRLLHDSDNIEIVGSLTRLALCLFSSIMLYNSNETFLYNDTCLILRSVGMCFIIDSIGCIFYVKRSYNYCIPMIKSCIGFLIIVSETMKVNVNFIRLLCLLFDCCVIIAKVGWLFTLHSNSATGLITWRVTIWTFLWIFFLIPTIWLLYCVIESLRGSSFIILSIMFMIAIFFKIRDISEAFQIFFISIHYKERIRIRDDIK